VAVPSFPEADHPFIASLAKYNDNTLITLFQRYPAEGKYFTALFCRYSLIVYALISHRITSPVQTDYLFAFSWRHIFYEMGGLVLSGQEKNSFQNWIINMTVICLNEIELPLVEQINYNITTASPPLWCYLEQALNRLPPLLRLILIMAENFHWSIPRITTYLQAEGETITQLEIPILLTKAHRLLEKNLPEDIKIIYINEIQ
jgi:hypothetical protein